MAVRVRLTDQALAAVTLARAVVAGGPVTAPALLAGLAAEPDGRAGRALRERASAAAALGERAGAVPGASLDDVLRRAATVAGARPIATDDLLGAALEHGGPDLVDLLTTVGYDPAQLVAPGDAGSETYGLGTDDDLEPTAALAAAQVRARGAGAVELLIRLAELTHGLLADADVLRERRATALRSTPTPDADEPAQWDTGLDSVVTAAGIIRAGATTTPSDLVRAALLVGGEGPRALLEEDE